MDATPSPTHRTVALVGGAGSGKTTLAEGLLFRAGAIQRRGTIEQGTTVCDHDPEEIARQTTLGISLAYLTWTGPDGAERAITLIDTPGHPDFVGGVDTALPWRMSRPSSSARSTASPPARARCGRGARRRACRASSSSRRRIARGRTSAASSPSCAPRSATHLWPLELPLGEEQDFHAVADVLGEHALVYDDTGHHHEEPLPAAAEAEEHDLHVSVTEEIVSHDDAQLEAYLDGNEPSADELERTLAHEVASGEAVPVLLCSGLTGTGVDRVADLLCALSPPARDHDSRIVVGGPPRVTAAPR